MNTVREQQAFDAPTERRTRFEILIDSLSHIQAAIWALLFVVAVSGFWFVMKLDAVLAALRTCS